VRSDDVIAGRYRLVELIGHGGTGVVWAADDLWERRRVALKRPRTGGRRADLEREADLARRVAHPGAVTVTGVVGDGDDAWLLVEHFPSIALAAMGVLPPTEVAAIGVQVAAALAAAHAAGVVHRDVTPANVLVGADGTAKVTDFGISGTSGAGTAAFVSPEVADGLPAGPPADVFSLGATLFSAVEGAPPPGGGDATAVLTRVRAGRRAAATSAGDLASVLDALLRPDPAGRPTAARAGELLGAVVAGRPVPAVRGRPRTWLVAGAAAVAVVVLVLAVVRPWESPADGPARTVLGDPRTADPCALADVEVLRPFGDPVLDPDRGALNRCHVLVAVPGGEVDVVFRLGGGAGTAPAAVAPVVRHAPARTAGGCAVSLTLADRFTVAVVAGTADPVATDLCAVVDAATGHVAEVLRAHDVVPRRPVLDARSLASVDACSLVTGADLAAVPGLADAEPRPGYANWECRWHGAITLRVVFDRGTRLGEHTRAGRRDVYVRSPGPGACSADVVNRTYPTAGGSPVAELAVVAVTGEAPGLCTLAAGFATAVAKRLPALTS
jgi:hypothetical protein